MYVIKQQQKKYHLVMNHGLSVCELLFHTHNCVDETLSCSLLLVMNF